MATSGPATTNMGSVTDEGSVCRFRMGGVFRLNTLDVTFSGGTGTADLVVWRDDHRGTWADKPLYTFEDVGTDGTNAVYSVGSREVTKWTFQPGDVLVLVWTNPDGGTMEWRADVELVNA